MSLNPPPTTAEIREVLSEIQYTEEEKRQERVGRTLSLLAEDSLRMTADELQLAREVVERALLNRWKIDMTRNACRA